MSTTETERRLTAALHARADLVQPEDLRHEPVLPGVGPEHPRRRRVTTYVAAVAAAAAAVAATYVLGTDREPARPQPAPQPGPPEGWQGGVGRTGAAADLRAFGTGTADLDGDGLADTVWVRSTGGEATGPVRVEVLLSSQPDDVRWTVLGGPATYASPQEPVQLDTDHGEELVLSVEDETSYRYVVVELVDDRLQEVPAPAAALTRRGPGNRPTQVPRVVDGRLLTWSTRGPVEDTARYLRVDATWWTIAEVDGEHRLVEDGTGELCIDTYDALAGPCLAGDRPDAELPDMSGDNPGDVVPDLVPVVGRLDTGSPLEVDATTSALLTGTATDPTLEVRTGDVTLTADLGSGEPARLVAGTAAGGAGPVLLVDRGATWSAYVVRDGALARLYVADDVVLGTSGDTRTELSRTGLLWTGTRVGAATREVERVVVWQLDLGPGLLPQEQGCFRIPADGSAPTFATC